MRKIQAFAIEYVRGRTHTVKNKPKRRILHYCFRFLFSVSVCLVSFIRSRPVMLGAAAVHMHNNIDLTRGKWERFLLLVSKSHSFMKWNTHLLTMFE